MARGSRNTSARSRDFTTPTQSLPRSEVTIAPTSYTPLPSSLSLLDFEDLRLWHPDPEHGSMTFGNRYASVTVHQRPVIKRSKTFAKWGFGRGLPIGFQPPVGIQYAHSFNVVNCVRRKTRRQVLHAKRKTGRGVRRRKPRRTWRSAIWC